jgi:8-oxo-dGTP pyrophosphatase MutT (NUDIX family)
MADAGSVERLVLRDRMRRALSAIERREIAAGFKREAAVLVPVFEREGQPHFLLIRRTDEVPTHKGQIAFPGGGRHPGEGLEETALRETLEEIGIGPGSVELLGRYHDYFSSTEYRVAVFAGALDLPIRTLLDAREVAEVIEVPFAAFQDPAAIRVEPMFRLERWVDVHFVRFGGREIWGLTARIILDLLAELGPEGAS